MFNKSFKAVILVLVMIFTAALPGNASGATKFSDIRGHWAEKYINQAVGQGIIKGYQDGTFRPDNAVTRAEFISMVNRALKCNGSTSIAFNDVYSSQWYYADVAKAVSATYVAGYEDNTFKPNNPISRQEVSVMISRFVPTYNNSGSLRNYSDYRSVDDWASTALSKVNGKGYIGAYSDGKIHPRDALTRAQTAKILCDILAKENIVTSDTTVSKSGTKLSDKIYTNDVTVHRDLGDNEMTLDNCVVLGTLYVQGGGTNSVIVNNSRIANASVNKSSSSVRVYAKGETTIANTTAANSSILETSNLAGGSYGAGFAKVYVNGSANSTLRGSFPKVFVNGSSAKVNLESGNVSELTVDSSGRRSDITVASSATVSDAIVNAESYFHGNGTISNMKVNSNGITYESKPRNWTIASRIDTPRSSDPSLDISISPSNKSTKVKLDTDITITFNTAMTKYDGRTIYDSDISNFISLRRDSSSGRTISVNASINSSKKVITLKPTSNLESNTRYYVVIDSKSMKDTYGIANSSQISYFDTGDTTTSFSTTFSPENRENAVSVRPTITISFSESVRKYSNGASISSSDVSDIIYFKRSNSSGTNISYDVSSVSDRKIVIRPRSDLDLNTPYYVGIQSRSLKTYSNNTTVPADSVYWTTGESTQSVSASFSPYNGATMISANPAITINFPQSVVKYSNGASISSSDVSNIIYLRESSTSGKSIGYTVSSLSSSRIVITPTSSLEIGKTYYVGIYSNSIKTQSYGTTIPGDSVYWTTGINTPVLSNVTAKAYDNYVDITANSNLTATMYSVVLPVDASAPSVNQIVNGVNGAISANSATISGNSSATIKLKGLSSETSYNVYTVLKDGSGAFSSVDKTQIKTSPINLSAIIIPGAEGFSFDPTVTNYDNVYVPNGTQQVTVTVKLGSTINGSLKINDKDSSGTATIDITNRAATVVVSLEETGKTARKYTINIKEKGTADVKEILINDDKDHPYKVGDTFMLEATTSSIKISVTTAESDATIMLNGQSVGQGATINILLSTDETKISIPLKIRSSDGVTSNNITINFERKPKQEPVQNPGS